MLRLIPLLFFSILFLTGCADPMLQQRIEDRRLSIMSEPRGDYFIGRRFHIDRTQFWGYIRRPGQSWDDSRLVLVNENQKLAPDRLPELPTDGGLAHGFDHNREYKMHGHFTGRKLYDPNSDLYLPEFVLTGWEVQNESPGWLFRPNEKSDGQHLLRYEKQN